ncbi:Hypothetical protein NTJ_08086 [Nesidiocoris tenuis]|uniref:C2H2-type domain-containing protein n=1 Tax=Nesidiocoris tenuis TaxID=355587 RepID=A0ABN7AWE9_9HEMI|nr:Hypothetical protein NTJ_08086 [Nesidiocoris tenuis]
MGATKSPVDVGRWVKDSNLIAVHDKPSKQLLANTAIMTSTVGYEEITISSVKIEPFDPAETLTVKSSSSEGDEEPTILIPASDIKMDPDDPLAATETVPREDEETMDEEAEKEKKDDENGDSRQYTCLRCGFVTKKDEELREHMFSWHPDGMKDSLPKYLQKKIENVKKGFKCHTCLAVFPLMNMLKVHELQHLPKKDVKKVRAVDCPAIPQPKSVLQPSADATPNTQNSLKRKSDAAEKVVLVPKQPKDYAFASSSPKGGNQSPQHPSEKKAPRAKKKKLFEPPTSVDCDALPLNAAGEHQCVQCSFRTKKLYSLKRHYRRVHCSDEQKRQELCCSVCKREFSKAYQIETHVCVPTSGKTIDCDSSAKDEVTLDPAAVVGEEISSDKS